MAFPAFLGGPALGEGPRRRPEQIRQRERHHWCHRESFSSRSGEALQPRAGRERGHERVGGSWGSRVG